MECVGSRNPPLQPTSAAHLRSSSAVLLPSSLPPALVSGVGDVIDTLAQREHASGQPRLGKGLTLADSLGKGLQSPLTPGLEQIIQHHNLSP